MGEPDHADQTATENSQTTDHEQAQPGIRGRRENLGHPVAGPRIVSTSVVPMQAAPDRS